MPQLLDRSQVSSTIAVPLDLIEAETLSLLGVEIIDIEDNIDDCVPQGDIRYWVQRGETEPRRLDDRLAREDVMFVPVRRERRDALGGEAATIGHWQIKRDGNKRGILEIIDHD